MGLIPHRLHGANLVGELRILINPNLLTPDTKSGYTAIALSTSIQCRQKMPQYPQIILTLILPFS
ncbi:hypothetical protein [Okeania sp. SIO2B9]|uniref:hypothetical protein n=1 Tax=Okeania sp. SIO2B9 TaxID=2607782 RepID=UPI00257DABBB|nr:hypothetical protein [Okeania sp. SIO2B9]